MKKSCSLNEKIIKGIITKLIFKVHAEEAGGTPPPAGTPPVTPVTTPPVTPPAGTEPPPVAINFEDLMAKARTEEKNKLYPQITELKAKVQEMTEKNNQNLLKIQEKEILVASLEKELKDVRLGSGSSESEQVTKLQKDVESLTSKLKIAEEKTTTNAADVTAIEEKIKAEYEIKLYRETKLREEGDTLIPELVMGLTKEEIDASIVIAKTRYTDITGKAGKTPPPAKVPPANVSTSKMDLKNTKPQEIKDMTREQYGEFRKKLGFGNSSGFGK